MVTIILEYLKGKFPIELGRNWIEEVVASTENRAHDAILAAINTLVKQRIELVVKPFSGSSECSRNTKVENPTRTILPGIRKKLHP